VCCAGGCCICWRISVFNVDFVTVWPSNLPLQQDVVDVVPSDSRASERRKAMTVVFAVNSKLVY
jgi:hypothetical protein